MADPIQPGPLQVVVIDDGVRFALHVWRYLGRNLGFGIGRAGADAGSFFVQKGKRVALRTPDETAEIWWVRAGDDWEPQLREVCDLIKRKEASSGTIFLVDVRVSDTGYRAEEVVRWLSERWPGAERDGDAVMVLSSYARNPTDRKLWPKSPETLEVIARRVPRPPGLHIGEDGALEVLVTGAGFEYRYAHPGEATPALPDTSFGLPPTGPLIYDTPFLRDSLDLRPGDEKHHLPWPDRGGYTREVMKRLSRERLLDRWWDYVLVEEARQARGGQAAALDSEGDGEVSAEAQRRELDLRDAYRKAILDHDWGHMSQCVEMARLPWCAWLTTNYTRFADRAVEVVNRSKRRGERYSRAAPDWQLISIPQEAEQVGRGESSGQVPLFKLHGEISHLETMAIAGQDKSHASLLMVNIDLYPVYDAAKRYLRQQLRRAADTVRMRWRIVGHSLQDQTLRKVLKELAETRGAHPMEFDVVSTHPETAVRRLREEFQDLGENAPEVRPVCARAQQFAARLRPPD